MQEEVFMKSFR